MLLPRGMHGPAPLIRGPWASSSCAPSARKGERGWKVIWGRPGARSGGAHPGPNPVPQPHLAAMADGNIVQLCVQKERGQISVSKSPSQRQGLFSHQNSGGRFGCSAMPSQAKALSIISSHHPAKLAVALRLVSSWLQVASAEPDITSASQQEGGERGAAWCQPHLSPFIGKRTNFPRNPFGT